jgi:hypothetical protein
MGRFRTKWDMNRPGLQDVEALPCQVSMPARRHSRDAAASQRGAPNLVGPPSLRACSARGLDWFEGS